MNELILLHYLPAHVRFIRVIKVTIADDYELIAKYSLGLLTQVDSCALLVLS